MSDLHVPKCLGISELRARKTRATCSVLTSVVCLGFRFIALVNFFSRDAKILRQKICSHFGKKMPSIKKESQKQKKIAKTLKYLQFSL